MEVVGEGWGGCLLLVSACLRVVHFGSLSGWVTSLVVWFTLDGRHMSRSLVHSTSTIRVAPIGSLLSFVTGPSQWLTSLHRYESSSMVHSLWALLVFLHGSLCSPVTNRVLWLTHFILAQVAINGSLLHSVTSLHKWFSQINRYSSTFMDHSIALLRLFFMVHYRQMSRVIFLGSLVSDVTDLTLRFTSQGSY